MTRSPGLTPSDLSTLPILQTATESSPKLSVQVRPRAIALSLRPSSTWRSTNKPQRLNDGGSVMRAGVVKRSSATRLAIIFGPSQADVAIERRAILLQLLTCAGPADLALLDHIVALRQPDERPDVLVDHQDGDAVVANEIEA